jgi:hypothetical protein
MDREIGKEARDEREREREREIKNLEGREGDEIEDC